MTIFRPNFLQSWPKTSGQHTHSTIHPLTLHFIMTHYKMKLKLNVFYFINAVPSVCGIIITKWNAKYVGIQGAEWVNCLVVLVVSRVSRLHHVSFLAPLNWVQLNYNLFRAPKILLFFLIFSKKQHSAFSWKFRTKRFLWKTTFAGMCGNVN